MSERPREEKLVRWYFGGLACAGAVCVTHPLELIKVILQTKGGLGNATVLQTVEHIVKEDGFYRLYNGLTASIAHELVYSTARFGLFKIGMDMLPPDAGFASKILMAGFSGAVGGSVGVPFDLINVRMENDVKMPRNQRRNYRHAFNGLARVCQEEGASKLFSGCGPAFWKGAMLTIGQIACYDQIKNSLIATGRFKDDTKTHALSSLAAATIAATLTQPLDVLKTRAMNAKAGEYKSFFELIRRTAQGGPLVFYKGFVPAFLKIGPQTVITFIGLETLRLNYGYFPEK